MGLFDKKNCDICGEKIGLLGNRKLDDGNLCKNCASKLSPWFEERRHSTVEDIKRQLEYREKNKNAVISSFGVCAAYLSLLLWRQRQRKYRRRLDACVRQWRLHKD